MDIEERINEALDTYLKVRRKMGLVTFLGMHGMIKERISAYNEFEQLTMIENAIIRNYDDVYPLS